MYRQTLSRFFGDGYRVFFLSAAIFGFLSISIWVWWFIANETGLDTYEPPFAHILVHWHAHEMVFGYGAAALGGFFLTAVPNWTGAKAARHAFIVSVASLWLAGRIALWFSGFLPATLVAAVDLAFLPVLAAKIATQLIKRPKPQNIMFLGLLALIWLGNLSVHLYWMGFGIGDARHGTIVGLLGLCSMIAVLGGRITPAFTRNAMRKAGLEYDLPKSNDWLDRVGILSAILLTVAYIAGLADVWIGLLAISAGGSALARMAGWRTSWTLSSPILWSLHLSYLMLGVGYLLLGLTKLGQMNDLTALHILGIGAVGGMTLAMMSRAILGHSGRVLVAGKPLAVAYGLVAAAAVLRWAAEGGSDQLHLPLILASGLLWLGALALFVVALWSAFWGPRLQRPVATSAD